MLSLPKSALLTALLPAFAATASAQVDLVRTGGVVGADLNYEITAGPGSLFALLPSFSAGPLPLAVIDPGDPRFLEVGLDLPSLWTLGVAGVDGKATVTFPLPASPALQGLPLHAQAVTLPGATTIVDEISPATSLTLGAPATTVSTIGDLPLALAGHTATALDDGRVLLAGGGGSTGIVSVPGDRLYLFDPQTQKFSTSQATLQSVRAGHTATLLSDGRVLLVGGSNDLSEPLATVDIYDPVTDTVSVGAPMPGARVAHTATLLADGRVFVAGGANGFNLADPLAGLGNILESTLVYNPTANSWSNGPNLPDPRVGHAASRLNDGRVLLTGGLVVTNVIFIGPVPSITSDARYYNPSTNSLSNAPDFGGARALHAQTTLSDGRVLVAGGATIDILTLGVTVFNSTRVFNAGGWSNAGNLTNPRVYAQAVELAGGAVAVVGGLANVDTASGSGAPATAIDVSSGAFSAFDGSVSLLLDRVIPASVAIDGGERMLITGAGIDPVTGAASTDQGAETYIR